MPKFKVTIEWAGNEIQLEVRLPVDNVRKAKNILESNGRVLSIEMVDVTVTPTQ